MTQVKTETTSTTIFPKIFNLDETEQPGSCEPSCFTRYPILLVHGAGYRDDLPVSYWGRIPARIRTAGGQVYFSGHDAWGSIENNSRDILKKIEEIRRETGAEKVNIIAHSKGGLEARYCISALGAGASVASLTTVATAHHGSRTVDRLFNLPLIPYRFFCRIADAWFRLMGDKDPQVYRGIRAMETGWCWRFNREYPNDPAVFYQSFGGCCGKTNLMFLLTNRVVRLFDGENDGLVSTDSARWGEFKGIISGDRSRGITHADLVDMNRRQVAGIDIAEVYRGIVEDLKVRGY